ncbi:unnamed protein product [Clavelina lepadiformis]|uniref:Sushi, von Willebrand factor type A, EGF and pentraxin domain-containing protein 1 n=1 Tax=Clavelina lepadiformis TaxID=159417 RepID=A0ABP0G7Q7_CLALP
MYIMRPTPFLFGLLKPEDDPHFRIAPITKDPCLQGPDKLVTFPIISIFYPHAPIVCSTQPAGPNSMVLFDVDSRVNPPKFSAKYICDPGFSATGPTQFSCQSGTWNVELRIPNCTNPETGCGNPPFLPEVDIVEDPPYDLDETISYRCSEGFELGNSNASSISQCGPRNQWSLQTKDESFPKCLPTCHAPLSPPDGAVLLSADEILNKDTFSLGTEVTYVCEDPCSTHVKDTFTCTPSGWSGKFSSCPLNCNNPPSVANASIFPTSTREGSQARYFCDPGYYTSDATLIHCIHGKWISLEEHSSWSFASQFELIFPNCIEPTDGCGSPPLLINGAIERSMHGIIHRKTQRQLIQKYDTYDKITYSCIDRFYLKAPAGSVSTCLAGNRWSLNESASNFPMCEPDCGNLPPAANATMRVFSTTEGSVAHYICDEGLSTNDVTTSTCRRNGLWDLVQLPRCRISKNGCGNPPMINNGFVMSIPPYKEGDAVTYGCFQGYELVAPGGSNVVCRQNEWVNESESPMLCFCCLVCLSLPTLPRGGVVLVDENLRNKDGISFSHGVEHSFGCQSGYRLMSDAATLTCDDGDWKWTVNGKPADEPLCYQDCGPPPKVANATVDALATVETWATRYICNPGLSASGKNVIKCDSSGKWVALIEHGDRSFPTCGIPSSEGGYYFEGPYYNDTVTYQCNFGFEIRAPSGTTSTCMPGNTWSLSPELANFPSCNTGSTLIGSPTLTCKNGMWLPGLPTCVRNCRAPPPVANSKIKPLSGSDAQSYEYVCDPGFCTNDLRITICLANGTWSLNRLPKCKAPKRGCGSPSPLQNGKYFGEAPFAEGASVIYRCKDDFKMVAPNSSVSTCQIDNKWSLEVSPGHFPECQRGCKTKPTRPYDGSVITLSEPVADNNGSYPKGSTIVYGCKWYKHRDFPAVSTCTENEWFPDLRYVSCQSYQPPPPTRTSTVIADTYVFYGPRRALNVAQTNDFIQNDFPIFPIIVNNTAGGRTNHSDFVPIISVCEYPGFCVGSPPDIYLNCSNQTLFECDMCGVGRAASFLFFVLLFGLAIFVGNALVIWVGYKRFNRGKGNKMDICKTSLAIADILTGVQILVVVSYNFSWSMNSTPKELNQQHSILRGSPQAYVGGIFFLFTLTSSLFHLVYLGGERLYAIAKPIRYRWQEKTSVYVGLGVVWILSLLSATVPVPIVVAASLFYSGHLDCNDIAQPYMICFYFSMTNSLVNFIVYSAREQDFRNEVVEIFRPGYLKQMSVQSGAQTPRKGENSRL